MNVLDWAHRVEPGAVTIYHSGPRRNAMGEGRAFQQAHEAHAAGLVFLCQARLPNGEGFAYRAHRISRPTAVVLGLCGEEVRRDYLTKRFLRQRLAA